VRFEIIRTAHEQWHWRIVASNGRILASCERAIESVVHATQRWVPTYYVDDRLKPMPRPPLPSPGSLS
jgi:uncharacterized protein YegP (UPF0339 family)